MKKNITKLFLILSSITLSFGLLVGIKSNNVTPVNAETITRCGVEAEWEEWTSTTSLPTSGYYYLGNNVTITSNNITINNNVLHLDLNGHLVSFEYEGDSPDNAITLSKSSEFSLYDSTGTGVIERKNTANYERFIYLEHAPAIFNLNGGTIRNFKNSNEDSYGGAVHIYRGTFNMNGGVITNCEAAHGGVVCVGDFGRANLSGGEIFNNTSTIGNGGGILSLGGLVNVSGSFYVHDNVAFGAGGGFYSGIDIETGSLPTLIFNGGFIRDNMSDCGCLNIDKYPLPINTVDIYSGRFEVTILPSLCYCETLESNRSNITFDKNGGTGGTDKLSAVQWGSDLTNIEVPTYEAHTFLGYFDQYGTKYFEASGRPAIKETSSKKWDYVGNQTLYAKWNFQVEDFSKQFISLTDGFCTESKDSVKSTLKSLFDELSPDDRQVFINTIPEIGRTFFGNEEIVLNAKSRYCYMISDYDYDDFLEIFDKDELSALRNRKNIISSSYDNDDATSIIIVACLTFVSFATLLCLFRVKKTKRK